MRRESVRQQETARGTFVRDVREAVHGGFQRFYVEQLNEVAAQHGLPVYKIPEDWGHCQHERTLRDWMRQLAPAFRAFEAMADPERQKKGPCQVKYGGRGKARGTKGGWAPLGGGGRAMAEMLHRIAAQSMVNLYNNIHGLEPLSSVEEIRANLKPERTTDVRAAEAVEDSLGPQQQELAAPPTKTRKGARR